MTTSTTERTLLMQSVTRRIPWLLDAVLTSIAANDHSELISVASELSLADRKMLAVQFRAAWDAAVRLRSQYRASILSFFNSVTKSAQLAAFNRLMKLLINSVFLHFLNTICIILEHANFKRLRWQSIRISLEMLW